MLKVRNGGPNGSMDWAAGKLVDVRFRPFDSTSGSSREVFVGCGGESGGCGGGCGGCDGGCGGCDGGSSFIIIIFNPYSLPPTTLSR